MLSPLVSWILSSSPSSSSSSEEEEDEFVDDGDQYENVGENEHFLHQAAAEEELPSTSCAGDTKTTPVAAIDTPGAGVSCIPDPTDDTNSRKRRRINQSYGRRQRQWTKQDEIELLRDYLGYIKHNRWVTTSLQNDVTFFYDQTRPKLNKDFNKNQVVAKLRALKKKHQTVSDKFNSGREVLHKSPQEEVIFEISERIWGKNQDHESSPEPDADDNNSDGDESGRLNEENKDIKKLIEETMRSCLSPLNDINVVEGLGLKLVKQYGSEGEDDENEKKQRILELEAYLKQLELLQDQIKSRIEELRS